MDRNNNLDPPAALARTTASCAVAMAAVAAAMIAVAAIATLNWIVFQLPASASSAEKYVSQEAQMLNANGPQLLADGVRRVKTFVVHAKDDSGLVPLSDNQP